MSYVKHIRDSLGLSKQALAQALGVTKSAINNYENGFREPRPKHAIKLVELAKARGLTASLDLIYQDSKEAGSSSE